MSDRLFVKARDERLLSIVGLADSRKDTVPKPSIEPPKSSHSATGTFVSILSQPSHVSLPAVLGGVVAIAALIGSQAGAIQWMYHIWTTNPDNSHGFLVPFFSATLLWMRRSMVPLNSTAISVPSFATGLTLIAIGAGLNCTGIYCRIMTLEAVAILPCVAGLALCCGGWPSIRWAWPSILFLVFMIPLPHSIGIQLGGTLQRIATVCSTYVMQLLGLPAIAEGNVIFLSHATLGVAEACSGIRMLMSFFALTTALCFVVNRATWEKCLIWLTAPLIAVVANVLRITATGIAYEFGNEEVAKLIFHDLAGWLMMPIGLSLLAIELYCLSKIFPTDEVDELTGSTTVSR